MIELRTARLLLRNVRPKDVEEIFAIVGDPEVMRFMPKVYTREEAESFWMARIRMRQERDGHTFYAVTLAETGEFLGLCGPLEQEVEFDGETHRFTEVGYHFQRRHWSNGYAAEAAIACRNHVFETLARDSVISLIHPENVPSQRVALRNGMTRRREGVQIHDLAADLYQITREEWNALEDKNAPRDLG